MVNNNIILGIFADFNSSKDRVLEEIKKGLTETRKGYDYPHSTTGLTANSIEVNSPFWDGSRLTWDFKSDAGYYLNKGEPTPSGGGGGVYYEKITTWVQKKYKISDRKQARRIAGAVINKHNERNQFVKEPGWMDERVNRVGDVVSLIINESIEKNINIEANKNLNKKIK